MPAMQRMQSLHAVTSVEWHGFICNHWLYILRCHVTASLCMQLVGNCLSGLGKYDSSTVAPWRVCSDGAPATRQEEEERQADTLAAQIARAQAAAAQEESEAGAGGPSGGTELARDALDAQPLQIALGGAQRGAAESAAAAALRPPSKGFGADDRVRASCGAANIIGLVNWAPRRAPSHRCLCKQAANRYWAAHLHSACDTDSHHVRKETTINCIVINKL